MSEGLQQKYTFFDYMSLQAICPSVLLVVLCSYIFKGHRLRLNFVSWKITL